jgi:hypothetical protein
MNLDLLKVPDPSGKLSKESYLIKNYPEEYQYIIDYCISNNIFDIPFREKVYLSVNNIKSVVCKNPNCSKRVNFKNSTIGYYTYCSKKCMGSDPEINNKKEKTSISKYGVPKPQKLDSVKDKIIKTNQERYGANSAMCLSPTQEKSKKTLLKNWGVDNPSMSPEILVKRIESFKLSDYKENYKKTSLERYGVEHPWMNKDIHSKTIDNFYSDYRERINTKINSDFTFIRFEKNISTSLVFKCHKCSNEFNILTYQFYFRINNGTSICTNCFPISQNASIKQIEIYDFIKENYNGDIVIDDKLHISPYEIDIYLPDIRIGFEFNGLYWHSEKFKDDKYHLKKIEVAKENNINLYTIWEDDWVIKKDICKSYILNKISKSNKIMGRKCVIREVSYNDSKAFLNNNHFQGDCKSSIRVGLYNNNELVSLMTFSKLRLPMGGKNKHGVYELTRFCNKTFTTVVGGSSKLLNYFLVKYNPIEIETYSDNLISNGDMYSKLGFDYIHTSKPGYWYLIDGKREHRFNFRKSKLVKEGFDKNKSEEEIMMERGYYRIYNAGNKKWIYKK